MEGFQDIEHFVESLYAAIKKKIPTKVSQLTNDAGYKTTDTNTTYKLSKSGSTVTLTGSDGSTTSVTDSNTTYSSLKNPYSLDIQINGVTVVSYDGSTPETVNAGNATASYSGLMSASDKSKLDGIDPSAITTNAANIKKNADAISAETTRAKAVEIPITKTTNVIHGTIVVYRIGHLLQIYANGLLIKRSTGYPDVHVCSIHNVDVDADGFTLGSNIAIWTAFDLADNPPIVSGPGLVLAQPNGPDAFDVLLIGVSGSSQNGVYFSLTVPLLDKKEE